LSFFTAFFAFFFLFLGCGDLLFPFPFPFFSLLDKKLESNHKQVWLGWDKISFFFDFFFPSPSNVKAPHPLPSVVYILIYLFSLGVS